MDPILFKTLGGRKINWEGFSCLLTIREKCPNKKREDTLQWHCLLYLDKEAY